MNLYKHLDLLKAIPLIAMIFLLATDSNAQGAGTDKLTGTWILDFNASINGMSSAKRAGYDTLKSEIKQGVSGFYKNRKFIFEKGSTYRMVMPNGMVREGSYTLSSDNLTLTDSGNGQQLAYRVKKPADNKLVLSLEGENADKAMIGDLYLNPSKK